MDRAQCLSCDRPAVLDGLCQECGAGVTLALTEDERQQTRDLIAGLLLDEDGVPIYRLADDIWMALYRTGFDIMRRPRVDTTTEAADG
jgi:hypothetical protein